MCFSAFSTGSNLARNKSKTHALDVNNSQMNLGKAMIAPESQTRLFQYKATNKAWRTGNWTIDAADQELL
jgi:hypothetical protein